MKKAILVLLCFATMIACVACKVGNDNSQKTDFSNPTDNNTDNISLEELFLSILNNKTSFYSAARQKTIYISDCLNIWQYAMIDLDSDGNNELAAMFDSGDILILRKTGIPLLVTTLVFMACTK